MREMPFIRCQCVPASLPVRPAIFCHAVWECMLHAWGCLTQFYLCTGVCVRGEAKGEAAREDGCCGRLHVPPEPRCVPNHDMLYVTCCECSP